MNACSRKNEARICEQDSRKYGLTVSPSTEQWWYAQSREAQEAAFLDGQPVKEVLATFDAWWKSVGGHALWGHGASFDAPVLEAVYRAVGWAPPWSYNATRCTRTLFEIAGVEPDRSKGVHHNALNDAKVQAETALVAFSKLGVSA